MHIFQTSKTLVICLLLFLGFGHFAFAQNVLDGTWQGKLYQDREPESTTFKVRMELTQVGNKVTGITHIHVVDEPEYRAQMVLEGSLHGAIFIFRETKVISKNNPFDWDWCLKSGRMLLKRQGEYWRLEGIVDGMLGDIPCVAADAVLERLDPIGKQSTGPNAKVAAPAINHSPATTTPKPAIAEAPQPKVEPGTAPATPGADYGDLLGRKITHQKDVEVHTRGLEILVWDADKEDGDVVSLSFNGQWLLQNHAVTKVKKAVMVKIEPGKENKLILYAESEGHMPPNTAAITFFDGQNTRNINLSSSKSTCGALRFVYKP